MSNMLRKLKRKDLDIFRCCKKKMQYKESHNLYVCMICGKIKYKAGE
jgi:transcription initiation factor IIE alpha subunit